MVIASEHAAAFRVALGQLVERDPSTAGEQVTTVLGEEMVTERHSSPF
jgi:hypothetical protein